MSREMTTHERQAVQRVERAIKRLPESVALYFHGDTATVLACGEDGRPVRKGEGFDPDATLEIIDTPRCAAGDW
jgi:hypothetical protein